MSEDSELSPIAHGQVRFPTVTEQLDLFRLLVQSIRDYAIFVLDPAGNVLTWNPGGTLALKP